MTFGLTTRFLQWLLLCCVFSLTGCSSFSGGFQTPNVQLTAVEVTKLRLLEQKLKLTFAIDNPNSHALRIRGLDYQVFLDETLIAEGKSSAWVKVPAQGSKEFQVPVRANLWQHGKFLGSLLKDPHRAVPYQLHGTLQTAWFCGLLTHKLPLDHAGEITPSDQFHR